MLKRFASICISLAAGLLASALVLMLAQHPAGVAWAAPEAKPLATTITVGGDCGLTIQACIDFAHPRDEVHIPAGLYIESVTVAKAISITGDLSSTTIIHAANLQRVMLITGTSVYISDLTLTGGVATATGGSDYADYGGGLAALTSTVTLSDVAATNNTSDFGGAVAGIHSTLALNGVSLHDNSAGEGGALYNFFGPVTITNGVLSGNSAPNGGGVFARGPLTITNSTLLSNTATNWGGGLYVYTGTQALIQGSSLAGNQSILGAAVFNAGGLVLSNTTVLSNTATDSGVIQNGWYGAPGTALVVISEFGWNTAQFAAGGIWNWISSTLTVAQTSFHDNVTTYVVSGAGALVNAGSASVSDSSFTNNHANSGAALYNAGTLQLNTSAFSNNQATGSGGALETEFPGRADISGTTFDDNSAAFQGGALYLTGQVTLTAVSLTGNSATQNGGAIASASSTDLLLAGGITVTGNTAQVGGGLFALGTLKLSDSLFISNAATADGGGLYAYGSGSISHTQLLSNTANNGGGVAAGVSLQLANSALASNTAANQGGALYVYTGTVAIVDNSQLVSNTATANFGAGGIYNAGTLSVTNSAILETVGLGLQNNQGQVLLASSVISKSSGGGLFNIEGSATITGSTIADNSASGVGNQGSNNHGANLSVINSLLSGNDNPNIQVGGGAISNIGASLAISNSTFVSNSAKGAGGGIFSYGGTGTTIWHSTFSDNLDGAIFNLGSGSPTTTLSISDSLFANNQASVANAGITNEADQLNIISSTFANNASSSVVYPGGAIYNLSWALRITDSAFYSNTTTGSAGAVLNSSGPASIANSTFSGNQAADDAGAIWLYDGPVTLNNVTLSGNIASHSHTGVGGGGVVVSPGTVVTLTNTIIAGNADGGSLAPDCAGTLMTGGHNLIQSTTGCTLSGTATGDITGTAALLGPLQDNGGPNWTQALLPGSPALDAGSPAAPGSGGGACEAADQRGIARPQGPACDIGAYESAGPFLTATVQFASSTFSALQSAGTAPITVTLSQPLPVTVTVQFASTDGTALAGQDYVAASGTVTFTPGFTQTTFAVPLLPEAPGEPDQAFTVALAAPTSATLGAPATTMVTLHDDAPQPVVALSSSQYTVTESDGAAIITVTLSAASGLTVTVHFATSNGTALAGSDYTAASGTLTFTPGLTQATFSVPITPDTLHEADETFSVALSSPIGASLAAPLTANVIIHDDDPLPAVRFSSTAYTVTESGGGAIITVTLSAASGLAATVHFAASDGTATAGSDYTSVSGTLTFAPGQVQQVFTVPIVNDLQVEGSETVQLSLSSPGLVVLGSPGAASLTILDDDAPFKLYLPLLDK